MYVMSTEQEDGVATMTITLGEDDHKFEVWADGNIALVEFQETLSWRGAIRTGDPDEDIYRSLMVSDEMTNFLDKYDLNKVKRADPEA